MGFDELDHLYGNRMMPRESIKFSNIKILLVEDDKLQADTAREYLEKEGYEITWVENGMSAIKSAKSQSFDLIVLDLVLPDIDGNQLCRWLKNSKDTQDIPIIILSAKCSTKEKVFGLEEAGADDYLPKPYDASELKARIYACLRTKVLQDELRKKNRQLEEVLVKMEILAMTDQLTGLFNRRHFESVIEKEFRRTTRCGTPMSCLMIDIDEFKNINDGYRHHVGDEVLREIAQLMTSCVREVDTVARWGGEEFVILLPETAKEGALRVAWKLLTSVSNHSFSLIDRQVTVSIGLASIPESTIDSSENLIVSSDRALYEAKTNGRNRVEVYLGNTFSVSR
jgi:diguanylate cyclase (GGDEF)-like protein